MKTIESQISCHLCSFFAWLAQLSHAELQWVDAPFQKEKNKENFGRKNVFSNFFRWCLCKNVQKHNRSHLYQFAASGENFDAFSEKFIQFWLLSAGFESTRASLLIGGIASNPQLLWHSSSYKPIANFATIFNVACSSNVKLFIIPTR